MRQFIVLLLLTGAAPCCFSQPAAPPQAWYYEAEGIKYYEAYGAVPGSVMAFYSGKGGGRLLKQAEAGPGNSVKVQAAEGFAPAMVVNTGKGGSKMVAYYDDMAFSIDGLEASAEGGRHHLRWKAAVHDAAHTLFTVWASADGTAYRAVATMQAAAGGMATYSYTAGEGEGHRFYRIQLHNSGTGLSYTTRTLQIAPAAAIKVFPTVVQNNINIAVPVEYIGAAYEIRQVNGAVLVKGEVTDVHTIIDLSDFVPGTYFIHILPTFRYGYEDYNTISNHHFVKF